MKWPAAAILERSFPSPALDLYQKRFVNEASIRTTATTSAPRVAISRCLDFDLATVKRISLPYGVPIRFGSLTKTGRYTRMLGSRAQRDAEGKTVEAMNVVVIKTDAQVLDEWAVYAFVRLGAVTRCLSQRPKIHRALASGAGEPIRLKGLMERIWL